MKVFIDGATNAQGLEAEIALISVEGKEFIHTLKFDFKLINSEAEYKALIAELKLSTEL